MHGEHRKHHSQRNSFHSNNIGQIAYLNAKQHDLKRIYFGGCFIRGHPITMNTLSYAINFWSNGDMKSIVF